MVDAKMEVKTTGPEPKSCKIKVDTRYDNGSKIVLEMQDLDPDLMPGLIAYLRAHRLSEQKNALRGTDLAGWTEEELKVISNLSASHDISPMGVIRQALRLYQMHDKRLADGETCTYSGDAGRARKFTGDMVQEENNQDV